jgi:hypothetical protein
MPTMSSQPHASVSSFSHVYPCSRAGRTVRIALTIHTDQHATHISGVCEGAEICGVAVPDPTGEFYIHDWTRCIHPRLQPDMLTPPTAQPPAPDHTAK